MSKFSKEEVANASNHTECWREFYELTSIYLKKTEEYGQEASRWSVRGNKHLQSDVEQAWRNQSKG